MKKNIQYMSSIQYKTRSAGLSSSCGLNRPAVGAGSPASLVVAGWPAPPMAPERASVARAQRHALPGVLRSTRAAKHKGCCKTPGCCKAHGMWCKAQGVCTGCAAKHLVWSMFYSNLFWGNDPISQIILCWTGSKAPTEQWKETLRFRVYRGLYGYFQK